MQSHEIFIDTGRDTMTGGRLKRVKSYIGDENFALPMVMEFLI